MPGLVLLVLLLVPVQGRGFVKKIFEHLKFLHGAFTHFQKVGWMEIKLGIDLSYPFTVQCLSIQIFEKPQLYQIVNLLSIVGREFFLLFSKSIH